MAYLTGDSRRRRGAGPRRDSAQVDELVMASKADDTVVGSYRSHRIGREPIHYKSRLA